MNCTGCGASYERITVIYLNQRLFNDAFQLLTLYGKMDGNVELRKMWKETIPAITWQV
jgi:hypothetical protein